jgi:hypothetical protein
MISPRTPLLAAIAVAGACHAPPAACPVTPAAPAAPVATAPTAPVAAPPPEATPAHPQSPEMAQLAYFLGTWQCDVEAFQFGYIPGGKYHSTIHVTDDLGGMWNAIRNSSDRASVAAFTGWFRAGHHYVRVGVDSRGGMEQKVSDGWTGNDWIWTGTFSGTGEELPMHHTLTKHTDTEFFGKYEVQGKDGQWKLIRQELCKK